MWSKCCHFCLLNLVWMFSITFKISSPLNSWYLSTKWKKEVSLLFIKAAPDIDHESLMMSWGVSQSNVLKYITLFPAHWTVKLKLSHHYLLLMITKWRTCQIKVENTSLSVRFEWKKIVKPFQLSNSVTDEEIRYALKILLRQAVDWVVF